MSPPKLSIYLHSVFQFGFALSRTLTQSYRPHMKVLFVTWRILARMWLATILCQLTDTFAGFLSTVCYLPAVALASYSFLHELYIWYDDLLEITGTKYRGLTPHNNTPMLGVHATEDRWTVFTNGCSAPGPR